LPRLAAGLTAAALFWSGLILAVPLLASAPPGPVWAAGVRAVGAVVCHQRPDRSFYAAGGAFPVCARCTGLYLSGAAGALAGWLGAARAPRRTRAILAAAALPTILTFIAEWAGLAATSNAMRAAAALPLGAAAGWCFVRMLREHEQPDHMRYDLVNGG
jgi:uncharacterized membrane protein